MSAAAIGKAAGGSVGFVKANGTYYVYASATDSGAPASGIGSVSCQREHGHDGADGGGAGGRQPTPQAGSPTQYRSAQLTAKATLAAGPLAFTVAGNATRLPHSSSAAAFSVTGDNTVPSASDVQATNVAGGTLAMPELNDTLILTYSEVMDWTTILAGWDGTTTNMRLRLVNGGGTTADYVEAYSSSQVLLPLGTVYADQGPPQRRRGRLRGVRRDRDTHTDDRKRGGDQPRSRHPQRGCPDRERDGCDDVDPIRGGHRSGRATRHR